MKCIVLHVEIASIIRISIISSNLSTIFNARTCRSTDPNPAYFIRRLPCNTGRSSTGIQCDHQPLGLIINHLLQMTFLGRKFFTSLQLNVLLFSFNGEAHSEFDTKKMEKVVDMAGVGNQDIREGSQNSLLQTDALYKYILETSVYPREPEPMKELRMLTAQHPLGYMAISADGGQSLNMLVKLINAKKTMEIGVFTGYSLLATALALPHDGQILALDINKENYDLGLPIIEKAGVAHKIDFRQEPALPFLDLLLRDEENHGSFDFVFIDADKSNYINYHKRTLELVKVGGVIAYDNTLWYGSVVAPPEAPMQDFIRFNRGFVMEFNEAIGEDPRIEICMLPVGDGITICRRIE